MSVILITGANGTVGFPLACLLKKRGYQLVYLVRDKVRFLRKTSIFDGDVVWQGDVTLPNCGVSAEQIDLLNDQIDILVHCAASVKFDEASAAETTRININGVINILELSRRLGISKIHHVSSAYVAGNSQRFTEDDYDIGQKPRNVYEQTKLTSEMLVRDWPHARFSIHRLGIVVGDSLTGFISSFNGYYGFLGNIWHLRQVFDSMPDEDRRKYEAEGIAVDGSGLLNLPIWGNFSPTSTLNIVPLDWTVGVMADLIDLPVQNKVFHIVDPHPKRIRWINDVSLAHLGTRGFLYQKPADLDMKSLRGRLQRMFDRGTREYASYIQHEPVFEVRNILRALGTVPPLDVNEAFLAKILGYAKSVNFGKKVKSVVAT